MIRTVIATAGAILLATTVSASAAMDCAANYKTVFDKIMTEGHAKVDGAGLAGINRMAVRAFDACQAGDESFAKTFFDKLAAEGKAKDFWEKMALEGKAK